MLRAVEQFGAKIEEKDGALFIHGVAGRLQAPKDVIDCHNSGLVLRLIGALAGLLPHYTILTGDHSIRQNRPVQPLLTGLSQLGAFAVSSQDNGHAPIVVRGPFTNGFATVNGEDSQPV